MTSPSPRHSKSLGLAVIAAVLMSAAAAHADDKKLVVSKAWMPEPPNGAKVAAGYMVLQNNSDREVTVTGLTSSLAKRNELHTMSMDGGIMRMRKLENGLKIAAGASETLEPGGNHVMFIGLTRRPRAGDTVEIKLMTDGGAALPVTLKVAPLGTRSAPAS